MPAVSAGLCNSSIGITLKVPTLLYIYDNEVGYRTRYYTDLRIRVQRPPLPYFIFSRDPRLILFPALKYWFLVSAYWNNAVSHLTIKQRPFEILIVLHKQSRVLRSL